MILIFRGGCFAMEWESLCADVAGDDDAEPRDGSFAACFIASPKSGVLARLACRERREEVGVEVTSGEEAGPGGGLYRHSGGLEPLDLGWGTSADASSTAV